MATKSEVVLNLEELMSKGFKKAQEFIGKSPVTSYNLNILVAGGTGVGKSTLINAVFGEEVAPTGQGEPVTQEIERYTKEDLSIYDTKGLEMKDFTNTKAQIQNFLDTKRGAMLDEQIHIAWLCIQESGRRIQEGEEELYKMLKAHGIPTILVITKAQQDKDDKGERFSEVVRSKFQVEEAHFERVRALEIEDDEGDIKKIRGIKELINKSRNLLNEAQKLALERKQQYDSEMQKKAKEELRQRRKDDAHNAILGYTTAAATIGATPIPFSDFALLLPTQIAMIIHISKIYDLEVSEENAKTLVTTFVGVLGTGLIARATAGSLLKLIPGVGSLTGGMINATLAGSVTGLMGKAFVAYLDDNFENLSQAIKELCSEVLQKYLEIAKTL
ncbi:YcjF family protein [Helicobacter baculiformis]|uniref:YcjF family protein n=1 Tax=Helicobacter baculiformis TaxID=427351 RepID=A0ABV7ZLL3_9HELI|nr:DUF697 domain-containing protein [Helicobacter baculiformis]